MSVFAGALSSLGEAIQGEISLALKGLRDELEQERKLRILLDDQLSNLKQSLYTKVEVDQLVADLRRQTEEKVATAKADCEQDLRLCQRELEHRIETALASKTEGAVQVEEKQKTSTDDAHLLSLEIDRKVGTMLVDVDRRLEALKEEFMQMNCKSVAETAGNVQELSQQLQDQISQVQGTVEVQIHDLQQEISSSSSAAPGMVAHSGHDGRGCSFIELLVK